VLLANTEVVVRSCHVIAISEVISFLDGPPGPVDASGAVVDLVHAGVASVVDQAAAQEQSQSDFSSWEAKFFIVGIEDVKIFEIVEDQQLEF